jgi:hypothetical protein
LLRKEEYGVLTGSSGAEGLIVVINREAKSLCMNGNAIEVGNEVSHYFSTPVTEKMVSSLESNEAQIIRNYHASGTIYDITTTPLAGRFRGKGLILNLKQVKN